MSIVSGWATAVESLRTEYDRIGGVLRSLLVNSFVATTTNGSAVGKESEIEMTMAFFCLVAE